MGGGLSKGKGRFGRSKAHSAATAGGASGVIDEEAQQEVTVIMTEKLPGLLTRFQADPQVVSGCAACRVWVMRGGAVVVQPAWHGVLMARQHLRPVRNDIPKISMHISWCLPGRHQVELVWTAAWCMCTKNFCC